MKKYIITIIILPILVIGLSGCYKKTTEKVLEKKIEKATDGQIDIDINKAGSEMTFEDEETGAMVEIDTTGNLDLPAEWPGDIKVYKDADIISHVTNTDGVNLVMNTKDEPEKVITWYDKEFKDWEQVAAMNIGDSIMRTYDKGAASFAVIVGTQDGKTMISNTYFEIK